MFFHNARQSDTNKTEKEVYLANNAIDDMDISKGDKGNIHPQTESALATAINRPDVIELEGLDHMSPSSGPPSPGSIKFHRSPRQLDSVDFIARIAPQKQAHNTIDPEKIGSGGENEQNIQNIIGNIPHEYFRHETKYESIDAVLDHISKKREQFMGSIKSSPHNEPSLTKTIEPIVNAVSPHVKESKVKAGNTGIQAIQNQQNLNFQEPHFNLENASKAHNSIHKVTIQEENDDDGCKNGEDVEKSDNFGEKHITFEKPRAESGHVGEQEVGSLYVPENEIINFQIPQKDDQNQGRLFFIIFILIK